MPIDPAHIKRPAAPVPKTYVPPGGRQYSVQSSDDWGTLAAPLGVSAWDLIRYNYPGLPADLQLAAKEVNWYLQNYVGCTQLTADRRNYKFGPPGQIWLPPAPLTPNQAARQLVLSVLRGPVVKRMTFGVGFLFIHASYYEDVAKAIDAGTIQVQANPALGHMAYYFPHAVPARIEVSPTLNDMGLIVHECTHAIFDMRKLTSRVEQSEGFGYLAQALYGWLLRGGPPATRYMVSQDFADIRSWGAWQMVFDESTRLAGTLTRSFWISDLDAADLYAGIRNANVYRSRVGRIETNDGI
jgi:hypothetical protein